MSVSELEQEVTIMKNTIDKQLDKIDQQRDSLEEKEAKIDQLTVQLAQANMEIMLLKHDVAARDLSEPSAKRSR